MGKELDLRKTVYELSVEHEEFVEIMRDMGFSEITKKAMLHSVGKLTTLPKGCRMRNIPLDTIVRGFEERGFRVIGLEDAKFEAANVSPESVRHAKENLHAQETPEKGRTEQIKTYLKRLGDGEDLESVRADFAKAFSDVEASEIMRAEQELMKEGTPLEEVQKLCDVHSALFHGATREEKIMNAEREVAASLERAAQNSKQIQADKDVLASRLIAVKGHPLQTLTKENEMLTTLLGTMKDVLARGEDVTPQLKKLREISTHYAKKGDLLYPNLKVKYDITGPSQVMWTVDDEIRDELAALDKESAHDSWWVTRLENVMKRAEEMIYKEQNILFPICAVNFTNEEWYGIYHDAKDYADCMNVTPKTWEEAEESMRTPKAQSADGEIVMRGGHMTLEQLTALLNTIPLEITFVDADNINRYFNEGPKVFKRPGMAIDRDVFSCHPPKIEPMVRSIVDDFREGRRDSVEIWMEKVGKPFLVAYRAVRDYEGNYLGTVEIVQDMAFAKEHFLNDEGAIPIPPGAM